MNQKITNYREQEEQRERKKRVNPLNSVLNVWNKTETNTHSSLITKGVENKVDEQQQQHPNKQSNHNNRHWIAEILEGNLCI